MIYFHFRDAAYLRDVVSEVRISEQNTKEKLVFIFIFERKYLRDDLSPLYNYHLLELYKVTSTALVHHLNFICFQRSPSAGEAFTVGV